MKLSKKQISKIKILAAKYGAKRILVFGSYLEENSNPQDLDLAVEGVNSWDFYKLAAEIETELGLSIDIVDLDNPTSFTKYIEDKSYSLI